MQNRSKIKGHCQGHEVCPSVLTYNSRVKCCKKFKFGAHFFQLAVPIQSQLDNTSMPKRRYECLARRNNSLKYMTL